MIALQQSYHLLDLHKLAALDRSFGRAQFHAGNSRGKLQRTQRLLLVFLSRANVAEHKALGVVAWKDTTR